MDVERKRGTAGRIGITTKEQESRHGPADDPSRALIARVASKPRVIGRRTAQGIGVRVRFGRLIGLISIPSWGVAMRSG